MSSMRSRAISLAKIHVAQWDGTTAGATEFLRALADAKWLCLSLHFEDDIFIDRMKDSVGCSSREQRHGRFLCASVGQRQFTKLERSLERRYRERYPEEPTIGRQMLWDMDIVVGAGEWAVSLSSSDQGPYIAIYTDDDFRRCYALVDS